MDDHFLSWENRPCLDGVHAESMSTISGPRLWWRVPKTKTTRNSVYKLSRTSRHNDRVTNISKLAASQQSGPFGLQQRHYLKLAKTKASIQVTDATAQCTKQGGYSRQIAKKLKNNNSSSPKKSRRPRAQHPQWLCSIGSRHTRQKYPQEITAPLEAKGLGPTHRRIHTVSKSQVWLTLGSTNSVAQKHIAQGRQLTRRQKSR